MTDYVTHAEFKSAMSDINERFVRVESRLEQTATKTDIADLRSDIHKSSVEVQRWMIATVIGLFVGFGGLFMAMSNALKPSTPGTPAAQPAPIIIQVPTPPAAPPPAK